MSQGKLRLPVSGRDNTVTTRDLQNFVQKLNEALTDVESKRAEK